MSNNTPDHFETSFEQSNSPGPATTPGARLILILGGARSGKSTFAMQLAMSSDRPVAFIATATAEDEEMRTRIARHRAERPQAWQTIEEPLDLPGALRKASAQADILLLDCLTLWTSNWLTRQSENTHEHEGQALPSSRSALAEIEAMLHLLNSLPPHKTLIVISNEVGQGIVPAYPLGRLYRDTLGYINQRLACSAERVYLLVASIAIDIKRFQELPLL